MHVVLYAGKTGLQQMKIMYCKNLKAVPRQILIARMKAITKDISWLKVLVVQR